MSGNTHDDDSDDDDRPKYDERYDEWDDGTWQGMSWHELTN